MQRPPLPPTADASTLTSAHMMYNRDDTDPRRDARPPSGGRQQRSAAAAASTCGYCRSRPLKNARSASRRGCQDHMSTGDHRPHDTSRGVSPPRDGLHDYDPPSTATATPSTVPGGPPAHESVVIGGPRLLGHWLALDQRISHSAAPPGRAHHHSRHLRPRGHYQQPKSTTARGTLPPKRSACATTCQRSSYDSLVAESLAFSLQLRCGDGAFIGRQADPGTVAALSSPHEPRCWSCLPERPQPQRTPGHHREPSTPACH